MAITVKSRVAYQDAVSELKQFKPGEKVWVLWSGVHDYSDAVRQVRRLEANDRVTRTSCCQQGSRERRHIARSARRAERDRCPIKPFVIEKECMASRVVITPSVLLVNDARDEGTLYARALRAYGYHAVTAATSVTAYHIAMKTPTDVLVTDVDIVGSMSGLQLARRLRMTTQMSTASIIVLTPGSRPQDGDLVLEAGADAFLVKPVAGDVLRAHVTRLLDTAGRRVRNYPRHRRLRRAWGRNQLHHESTTAFEDNVVPHSRTCPQCSRLLQYRQRWPVLSVGSPTSNIREPRERLHYESGWFCTNEACAYQELRQHNGCPD